jgi:hypothetical protein
MALFAAGRRVARARIALARIFLGRFFWLFAALRALVAFAPFVEPTPFGKLLLGGLNAFIIVAAVATVGRSGMSFVIAVLLGVPAFAYQVLAQVTEDPIFLVHSWWFAMAMYAITIVYLLRYVFMRDVMTADKLWGAAAAYLLLGAAWTFAYALVGHYHADAFAIYGTPTPIDTIDLLYFSFTTLTSTGYGDITPLIRPARSLCVIEQITGTLYLTILIARLAGVYPPPRRPK